MPARKFRQRLLVISLRINRRAAIRSEMREEFLNPFIRQFRLAVRGIGHGTLIQYSAGLCSKMPTAIADLVSNFNDLSPTW
jgi:hypothetical protein